ncbi:MAG TPA: alpha/beta hydrolase, partial [Flavitalea sp.]|nr:alpha/beta hydrolase [Flavitalea sp.]
MKTILNSGAGFLVAMILSFVLCAFDAHAQNEKQITNVVLVHGAFVDGSGWEPVYHILAKKGYHVTITQQPLTSFEDDVAAVNRVLQQQDGPCILVGHSYGGAVISIAGNKA